MLFTTAGVSVRMEPGNHNPHKDMRKLISKDKFFHKVISPANLGRHGGVFRQHHLPAVDITAGLQTASCETRGMDAESNLNFMFSVDDWGRKPPQGRDKQNGLNLTVDSGFDSRPCPLT